MEIKKIIDGLTLEEKAGLCSGHDFWHTKPIERFQIPKVMMCDGPHGLRKQQGQGDHMGIHKSIEAVCFPTASALASSFDVDLIYQLGETLGEECQAEGLGMLLGPGLNMKRSPLCGRNFEYMSEDPYLAGKMGATYIKGLQGKGIAACVKHYAANNQETRRMNSDSQVDERTLHEIYLPAFEMAVKEGKAKGVMCSYNKLNGSYLAENKEMLTDILRKRWGFQGMVVTDWGAVKDRVKGLLAGLDLEMPGGSGVQEEKIIAAVKSGELPEEILDEAVKNILNFVMTYQSSKVEGKQFRIQEDRKVAEAIAIESAVLLKNQNEILPLDKKKKIAFIGEFAEKPRFQGAGSSYINVPHVTSAMEAAKDLDITYAKGFEAKEEVTNAALLKEAIKVAKEAEVAILFVGLPDAFEIEGVDRTSLDMPQNQNELIEAVTKVQQNTIVVLHGGAPVIMPWRNRVAVILHMYLGGDGVGAAAAVLLFGDANPSGKLAETFPLKLEDNPSYLNFPDENGTVAYNEGIYIGYRYYDKKKMEVQYPFGHGLSYTTFTYSDIKIDKMAMNDDEVLTVSCKVKNTGNYKGKEVVQLYIQDKESTVRRPIRELKEFQKIELKPGEEKEVSFQLDKRSFAYYEPRLHDWHIESGVFLIEIAASSRDIRLSAEVEVNSTVEIPVIYTKESMIGDLMKSARGQEIIASFRSQGEEGNVSELGEGSEKMVQAMMMEMPLSSLVSFGRMTEAQLDGLLMALNSGRETK